MQNDQKILQRHHHPSGHFRQLQSQNTPFILADFLATFSKFQNFVEQPIFVVQKRLIYEKVFICDKE